MITPEQLRKHLEDIAPVEMSGANPERVEEGVHRMCAAVNSPSKTRSPRR